MNLAIVVDLCTVHGVWQQNDEGAMHMTTLSIVADWRSEPYGGRKGGILNRGWLDNN